MIKHIEKSLLFIAIVKKKDQPSEKRLNFYERCLFDEFNHYCEAKFLTRELVGDMETNFF